MESIRESQGAFSMMEYADKSDSAYVAITVVDMKRVLEMEGESWEDWQQWEELTGMSKQDYCIGTAYFGMDDTTNVMRKEARVLTIDNKEAYELLYTIEVENIPAIVNYVFIFGEEDLGIVLFMIQEVAWPTFEECWPMIRDSVKLR